MRATDLIAKKRDGLELATPEIAWIVDGIASEQIPDFQIAAWLMAVYLKGMSNAETAALTLAMANSGQVLDLDDVRRSLRRSPDSPLPPIADKHSTGGVGDKTTITVAPLVASCGVPVGKMSGRGLGHTGGTLDKLESIPGFRTDLSIEQFKRQLSTIGIVLAGQSRDLAPADGRLYALRDVTATVASIPLIASSVMSKKIAAGADAIVLDVKVGAGAFMQNEGDAEALAQLMIQIGASLGRRVSAVIAGMDQPLGTTVGNSLEVLEAVAALSPGRKVTTGGLTVAAGTDFVEHCMAVAVEMLLLTGLSSDAQDASARLNQAVTSGQALHKFEQWIVAQGANGAFLSGKSTLPLANHAKELRAQDDGYVTTLDALSIGLSAMRLGAGREQKGDKIDHGVGIILHHKIGDHVDAGESILTVLARSAERASAEVDTLSDAIALAPSAPAHLVHEHRVVR